MDLKSLIVPSKETVVDYPGLDGFKVSLAYLTREQVQKIRKKATTNRVNKRTRSVEEELDSDLFQDLYIGSIIVGWSGLKMKYLLKMLPVNIAEEDLDLELEFSKDNAIELMKNSADFDSFITDTLEDVQNFTQSN